MSFKPEFQTAGNGDAWSGNAQRFATKEEAEASARNRYANWTMATGYRATECSEPVNYRWDATQGDVPVGR
jgi:hypothetical protein